MSDFDPKQYWEQRLAETPGLQGVGYASLGKQYNRWLYRTRKHVFLRQLRGMGLDLAALRVLDIGSGTGFYLDLWRQLGVKELVGSDLTEVCTARLRQAYPQVEIAQFDVAGDLSCWGGRKFDVVSAIDVMFHIVDDQAYERAVGNVHDLLNPGGLFVMSDLFLHRDAVRSRHVACRPLDQIDGVLRRKGFEIVLRRPLAVLMNHPMDTRWELYRKAWHVWTRGMCLLNVTGFLWGAALYPLERILVSCKKESPTTEMAVCRRVD